MVADVVLTLKAQPIRDGQIRLHLPVVLGVDPDVGKRCMHRGLSDLRDYILRRLACLVFGQIGVAEDSQRLRVAVVCVAGRS